MIVECPTCRARFRLDETKIKGRGARIRCRRCGESFVVLKPREPQAAPAPDAGGGLLDLRSAVRESVGEPPEPHPAPSPASPSSPPPVIAEEASPEPSSPAGPSGEGDEVETAFEKFLAPRGAEEPPPAKEEKEPPALLDLAVDFRPEEKIDLPAEPPQERARPDFLVSDAETLDDLKEEYRREEKGEGFDISGSLRQEPQDLLIPMEIPQSPPADAPPASAEDRRPAAPPDFPTFPEEPPPLPGRGDGAPSSAAPPEPQAAKEASRPKPPEPRRAASPLLRPSLVALILLFVVLAGGGAYLGFTKGGQELLRGLVPGMESLWLRSPGKQGPQFDVRNLIGYYEPNAKAGNLFVIKGQVANMGRTRKSGIRVRAALLDGMDQPVAERTCYAGNVLPGETLRTAAREKIEEALSNRFGDRLVNMDIAPGKSVPFMVVFFNAPEGISAYRLEAKEGD